MYQLLREYLEVLIPPRIRSQLDGLSLEAMVEPLFQAMSLRER
jgi:hypothetical protein